VTQFTAGEQVAYPADTLRPQVTFQVRPAQYQWDRNRAAAQPRLFFGVEVVSGCYACASLRRAAATCARGYALNGKGRVLSGPAIQAAGRYFYIDADAFRDKELLTKLSPPEPVPEAPRRAVEGK